MTFEINLKLKSECGTRVSLCWGARAGPGTSSLGRGPLMAYDWVANAFAVLGHGCFCHAVDVEGVGRVWTPAKDDDPLRALFRVISSSKAFYAAQKSTATLW